jgi:hypothetical protein
MSIKDDWYSKYDLHMVEGSVVSVDVDKYVKIYRRLIGLKKLDKPFETERGELIFVNKIAFIAVNPNAIPIEDYRDQQLLEMEEEAEMTEFLNEPQPDESVEITEEDVKEHAEEMETGAPDECDHSDLPIGMVTATNGVSRYFPYCPDCGHRGRLIRHADVNTEIIIDLNEKK